MTGEHGLAEEEYPSGHDLGFDEAEGEADPFAQALLHHRKGEMDRALQLLDDILARRPDHHRAALLATMSADRAGLLELSEMYARVATLAHPADGIGWYCLGLSLFRQRRFGEAAEVLERALVDAPSAGPARLLLGLIHWRAARRSEAMRTLDRARRESGGELRRLVRMLELRLVLTFFARVACLLLLVPALVLVLLNQTPWALPLVVLAAVKALFSWWLGRPPELHALGGFRPSPETSWAPRGNEASREPLVH
jgi:tetratricopeptide (TPR) repeat protein